MPGNLLLSIIQTYVYIYPLAMGVIWITAGLVFRWKNEHRFNGPANSPDSLPPVTILVPCCNEARSITATCESLLHLDYPDYRVVFVNDGSTDDTAVKIKSFLNHVPYFHLVNLSLNQGKARALNLALQVAVTTRIVVIIDADTILAKNALKKLVAPFLHHSRLGAVTANPIPLRRSGFWGHLQAAEFASIIGLIKRGQCAFGRIFTVSGCATAYDKNVLQEVNGFSACTATEDIDITWRIQRASYEIWFEPGAIAYIQIPMTFKDLWKQRCRWATGGWHMLRTHADIFTRWRYRRLWPLYLEFALGCLWALLLAINIFMMALTAVRASGLTGWFGPVVCCVCLIQMGTACLLNCRHDRALVKSFLFMPWYPLIYFIFIAAAVIWSLPRGLFGKLDPRAGQWQSPTRRSEQH